jgi:hypothetical protein
MANVISAFANAPVPCPARGVGGVGINLHVDLNTMEVFPHQDEFDDWTDMDRMKPRYFGTAAQRADATGNQVNAKKLVYRYAVFVHQRKGSRSSGRGELPGNDFIISLGAGPAGSLPGWGTRLPSGHTTGNRMEIESTFMHEMGHTLNLRHGGSDDNNCKPNYMSIMNYSFQFNWRVPTRPLDYSRSALATLNESAMLNEPVGVAATTPAGLRTTYGPPPTRPANTGGVAIDWDRNGSPNNPTASADINKLTNGPSGCTGTGTNLNGFVDWPALLYNFRATNTFSDGIHTSGFGGTPQEEMTPEMRQEMILASDNPNLVVDVTPPDFISFPGDMTVNTSDVNGTQVSYAQPVLQDNIDPNPFADCIPASGNLFAVGETHVNCLGSDTHGNFNERSFKVTVVLNSTMPKTPPSTPPSTSILWILVLLFVALIIILVVTIRR